MNKPPITDVLEHYGATRVPVGHRWRSMRCPLHDDRAASASVNIESDRFRCFVCDFSGDSLDLIARMEGCADYACTIECCARLFGDGYGQLLQQPKGVARRRVPFESEPVRGQRSILSARIRRRQPFAGA